MSCKPKTLFSILLLLTVALQHTCESFSVGTNRIFRDLNSLSDKTGFSRRYRRGALEFNPTNPISKRAKSAGSTFDISSAFSDGQSNETLSPETSNYVYNFWQPNNSLSKLSHNNEQPIRSVNKRSFDADDGFQADATAFEGPETSGNVYISQQGPKSQARDAFAVKPVVHCSSGVMTLTAQGKEYTHILVNRVDASPLYLFQLPAYCGYTVKVTWKDLVLVAPFDGCYITQENGSHVLSLLWWGKPIKVFCPMTRRISKPSPSVYCSNFEMIIQIEGAQEAVEKHGVKVKGKVLPLVSETCAYIIKSPRNVFMLHAAFNSRCMTLTDKETGLVIIVDGKQFTLSCPLPLHVSAYLSYLQSHPFQQPPTLEQPITTPKPVTIKPPVLPHFPYQPPMIPPFYSDHMMQPYTSVEDLYPFNQMHPPSYHQQPKPLETPGFPTQQYPQLQGPVGQYQPMVPPLDYSSYPISCPPYPEIFCSEYPFLYPEQAQPTVQPIPRYMAPTPPVIVQSTVLPDFPVFPPIPPEEPPKILSPSLSCTRNKITATLPSAETETIKVKDVKTNTWIAIAAAPAACKYTFGSRDGTVVLSSPLPACHTQKLSSSVISLSIRFWDLSLLRTRTLQLQCRFNGDVDPDFGIPTDTLKPLQQIIPQLSSTPARLPPKAQVLCSSQYMTVKLPPGPTSGLAVEAPPSGVTTQMKAMPLIKAPKHCGYTVKSSKGGPINIHLPFSSCHMTLQDGQHKIILKYQTLDGRTIETLLSCQASVSQECNVATDQRLVCGTKALSSTECHDKGCCFSLDTKMCYYPMEECTVDRHFVFSVHSSVANPPLSPTTLITAGNDSCSPQKVTADFALFKIPLDECGVHRYEVGKTVIYMVEILNRVESVSLNYGTITRDSPVRLLVECRYFPGSVVSVGYLVKSPSLGPSIKAQGVFGVQLKIAKDEQYNDFYPQYHQPLRMLLGKPLYLEVCLLNPPDPTAMLLVHYCVAYPRSAKSAWILIYDGCPNSLDRTPTHKPPATPAEALTNHVRRFTITTFQFLSEDDKLQGDEEIYFMCSTEVCLPSDGPCIEGCFGDPANTKS